MMSKRRRFDVNDLSTWGLPVSLTIALLIGFAIFSFWKLLFIEALRTDIQQVSLSIEEQKQQYTRNQSLILSIPTIKAEIDQLKEVRNVAKEFLPTQVSMPEIVDSIYSTARNNHIIFEQFTPKPDIDSPFYIIKPISLSATVTYSDMLGFIEDVSNLKRIITVNGVTFEAIKSDLEDVRQRLKMTAELQTYIFKDKKETSQP